MIATHICKELYKWILVGESKGTIHSIFKNSINILGDNGRLISVVTRDKPISPNGIKIIDYLNFDDKGIQEGDIGVFTTTNFESPHLIINYRDSILWDKKIITHYEKESIEKVLHKINLLGEFIQNHGNKNGIYNLLPVLKEFGLGSNIFDTTYILDKKQLFIKDRFHNFIQSFIDSKLDEINVNAKRIIGFGPGLTPSMDDFLSGIMIANIYISYYLETNIENAYKLNKEIIKDIKNKTTKVSEEMLISSSVGEANEDIRNLILCILSKNHTDKLHEQFKKVADIGDSSGTDILSGIYIGSTILLNKIKGGHEWV